MIPGCVIDAHVHLPVEPKTEPSQLVGSLERYGIRGAVILGLPSARDLVNRLELDHIEDEYRRVKRLIYKYAYEIKEHMRPEHLYLNVIDLITRYGELCDHKPTGENYIILAAANLGLKPEDLAERLEALASMGFRGFKVISTLFFKYLDDEAVHTVFEVAEARKLPLVVHTGCDPGIWELPRYCRYGDPSRLEPVIRMHRDVDVVLAHLGGYSAIAPGVFTSEAIYLANKYDNVYLDTSAVPPYLVGVAAKALESNKMIFGSDYPVIDQDDLKMLILQVAKVLKRSGYKEDDIENVFHGIASRLFGVKCRV